MQLKLTFSLNPGAINRHRNELLTAIFNKVIQTRNQYIKSHIVKCTVACDAMVLGSLTIALRELKLSAGGPTPESYKNVSADELAGRIDALHLESLHYPHGRKKNCVLVKKQGGTYGKADCAVKDKLNRAIKRILNQEKGLDMFRYKRYRKQNQ